MDPVTNPFAPGAGTKREVGLVWNGKTREVCTAILPFQTLEHIDEPRKEKASGDELALAHMDMGFTSRPPGPGLLPQKPHPSTAR